MKKPFLFDNRDFDQLAEAKAIPIEERPQFSQIEMEGAVSGAQQRGFEEGLAIAVQSEEAKIARASEKLIAGMNELYNAEATRNAEAQAMAIEIATGLLRKLMPELANTPSLEGVSELVRKVMMDRFEEPRLIIRVHDSILDGLNERLQRLAQQSGFRGQYALMADTTLAPTDCRIEWSNGGVERSVTRLWDNIQISMAQLQAALLTKTDAPKTAPLEMAVPPQLQQEAEVLISETEEMINEEPLNESEQS